MAEVVRLRCLLQLVWTVSLRVWVALGITRYGLVGWPLCFGSSWQRSLMTGSRMNLAGRLCCLILLSMKITPGSTGLSTVVK